MDLAQVQQFAFKLQQLVIDLLFLVYLGFVGWMLYDTYNPEAGKSYTIMVAVLYLFIGVLGRFLAIVIIKAMNFIFTFGGSSKKTE